MIASAPLSIFPTPAIAAAFQDSIQLQGIAIGVSINPVGNSEESGTVPLREGDSVIVQFRLSDARTGEPYRGANPAAWIDLTGSVPDAECADRAARYVSGSLFHRPELDLNVFYVLALNAEPTITVVDPLFGFGGTKLLDLIVLDSPGYDWVIDGDDRYLYVSLPESDAIAVIETNDWSVQASITVGERPRRISIQPDGAYLWVSTAEESPRASGVDVIRVGDRRVIAHIVTGAGSHDLAFTPDSKFAFVTNRDAHSVSVIDIRELAELKELSTGSRPISIDYSNLAQAAYVAHQGDGKVAVIDGKRHSILQQSPRTAPGLVQVRVTPDGRHAFAPNPERNTVSVIDTATNRLIQTAYVGSEPDQISFTDENAYIRLRKSEIVLIVPLSQISEGKRLNVVDFPGGQHALGETSRASIADAIVQASGNSAVLVANPGDQAIYYYEEGMAAPMGHFSNYGHEPLATMVVERNLRERKAGEYETSVSLRQSGHHKIVFYLDTPEIVHCFDMSVAKSPTKRVERASPPIDVEVLHPEVEGTIGEPVKIAFKLTDRKSGWPVTDLPDVNVLVFSPAWQSRFDAADGSDGIYAVETKIPEPGTYAVILSIPSLGMISRQYGWLTVQAPMQ